MLKHNLRVSSLYRFGFLVVLRSSTFAATGGTAHKEHAESDAQKDEDIGENVVAARGLFLLLLRSLGEGGREKD
jgi:hypothetical protein